MEELGEIWEDSKSLTSNGHGCLVLWLSLVCQGYAPIMLCRGKSQRTLQGGKRRVPSALQIGQLMTGKSRHAHTAQCRLVISTVQSCFHLQQAGRYPNHGKC